MKKIRIWIVAFLFMGLGVSYSIEQPKRVYEVLKGDTSKMMQKGGSSINIQYSSEHVDTDTPSRVHITLTTPKSKGLLSVEVYSSEDSLKGIEHKTYQFPISSFNQEFTIDLEPFSLKEGRFYINIIASLEKERPKILAIPVEIGDISKNIQKSTLSKTEKGEQLHIMKAQEEIK